MAYYQERREYPNDSAEADQPAGISDEIRALNVSESRAVRLSCRQTAHIPAGSTHMRRSARLSCQTRHQHTEEVTEKPLNREANVLTLLHHLVAEIDDLSPGEKLGIGLAAAKPIAGVVVLMRPGTGRHRRPRRARK